MDRSTTCEAWHAWPGKDGMSEDATCGKPAVVILNGFSCCGECLREFEAEGLVETIIWGALPLPVEVQPDLATPL